ncbi:MAG: methyltransferase domain-containing protein [Acidobacteria bacterium]|nr:methyltransferase domain-containing protein [Acidobacteriota bacterium]
MEAILVNYWDLARTCTQFFRQRRFRNFHAVFPPAQHGRVLDIGGTPEIWEMLDYPGEITLVNPDAAVFERPRTNGRRTYRTEVGDGRGLEYADKAFDLAFANSVIEHVGDEQDASAFAREIQRVGKAFYCQTPNKWFPVEPHLGTLFLHWVPGLLNRYWVIRYCTLWGLMNKPSPQDAADCLAHIRLLTKKELRKLFPDAEIHTERFLFVLPKSFIVIRRS